MLIDKRARNSIYYLWLKTGCDELTYRQFRRHVSGRWLVYLNDGYEMGLYHAASADEAIAEGLDDAGYRHLATALRNCGGMDAFRERFCTDPETRADWGWIYDSLRAVQL